MSTRRPLTAAFRDAARGVLRLVAAERNAKVHLAATAAVVAAAAWTRFDALRWAVLALAIGLVWAAEAANTALERLADAACPEHSGLVRDAKDIVAGGVLLASVAAAATGAALFLPLWCRHL
ncbi:MAG: diacylglycerol kinase family protein [Planctomycetota bacterium]